MLRPELIRRKLYLIAGDLELLERYRDISYEDLVGDPIALAAVERILERIVMRAVDVNQHLISTLGEGVAARSTRLTYKDSFLRLPDLGVVPPDVAQAVAPSAGLRNILVHEYNDVEHLILFESIGSCLDAYPRYASALLAFVDAEGPADHE
ncbi:MAG: DUF86 domain-containing protein [Rubricoccaceae bacterium]